LILRRKPFASVPELLVNVDEAPQIDSAAITINAIVALNGTW
jgi:hypothetical protein